MNLQSQAIYVHKKNFKQRICILEDGASGGASGCHWKDNCQKLV